jgi:hypothetical protein
MQKFHAEAGDNLQEYLQKILLQQTNENAIIVDCPEDEIQKIDALRNDKSRPEYLLELIAKDQNEQRLPAANSGFGEPIKTQILEVQGWMKMQAEELKGQTKTLHGTIEKDHKTILTLLKERLPYPDSWYLDGTLIERQMMKKAVIIFMGIEFFTMLAATFIFSKLPPIFWDVVRACIQTWQLWELLKAFGMVFWAMVMPCLVGALLWLAFPWALRSETFRKFLKR